VSYRDAAPTWRVAASWREGNAALQVACTKTFLPRWSWEDRRIAPSRVRADNPTLRSDLRRLHKGSACQHAYRQVSQSERTNSWAKENEDESDAMPNEKGPRTCTHTHTHAALR
jgi:hypothetical protein